MFAHFSSNGLRLETSPGQMRKLHTMLTSTPHALRDTPSADPVQATVMRAELAALIDRFTGGVDGSHETAIAPRARDLRAGFLPAGAGEQTRAAG
jgi:hypothetical protein